MSSIKILGMETEPPVTEATRMSCVLWGPSGSGKTTLSATAPGRKLMFMFDDEGATSLAGRDDCEIVPMWKAPQHLVESFKTPNPAGIEEILKAHPDIGTVVLDSLSSFGEKALSQGIVKAQSTAKGKSATIEDPGLAGYGNKNVWTQLLVSNLLASTAKYNKHMIFIAHEDRPDKDDKGAVMQITMLLGSSLSKDVPIKLNEVWHLSDVGTERRLAVRPCRARTPMKTRMFLTDKSPEFVLKYDQTKDDDSKGIAGWYAAWKANGFRKINFPG